MQGKPMTEGADLALFPEGIRLNSRRELPLDPRENSKPFYYNGRWCIWVNGFYTVPDSVSEERVQFTADRYMAKYGEQLERPKARGGSGYRVMYMERPKLDNSVVARGVTDPDRRRYTVWAVVTRDPVTLHAEVPDEDVPLYLAHGYRLTNGGW